jgi:lipoyl(octanoyl) transferase
VVIYPIMRLPRFREIVPLVRKLEEAAIGACARYGVTAERWSAHAGAWVGNNCICAIGLAVQKMTSLHGLALNASTVLDYDRMINPCGLIDRGITSLSHETGRLVSYDEAKTVLLEELSRVFDVTFVTGVIPSEANGVEGERETEDRRKAS